jgi:hypothetical protein
MEMSQRVRGNYRPLQRRRHGHGTGRDVRIDGSGQTVRDLHSSGTVQQVLVG